MSSSSPPPSSSQSLKDDYKEAYRYHSSTLRNWYVAFGIGAPVLFLSNEYLWKKIVTSCNFEIIALTFFLGAVFQVLLAFFDKYASWVGYYKEATGTSKSAFMHEKAEWWIKDDFWSIFLDLGSLVLFGCATFLAFSVIRS
jgi:presenilin-like A22 family membrane protease